VANTMLFRLSHFDELSNGLKHAVENAAVLSL
jgi:hypothetical protein